MPLSVGDEFNGYCLEEILGQSVFAATFRAKRLEDNAPVVLKIYRSLSADEEGFHRAQREIEAFQNLKGHPNIVKLLDAQLNIEHPFLVLEYKAGGNLRQYLNRHEERQLDFDNAIRIFRSIAEAIDFMSAKGFLHRDLKPENILIDVLETGQTVPYVTDFGFVQIRGRTGLTQPGTARGTWAYMAPEGWDDEGEFTAQSDIYSLGTMFYEAMEGHTPFKDGLSFERIGHAHLSHPVPLPERLKAQTNELVVKELLKALAKRSGDRHVTALAFVDALGTAYRHGRQSERAVLASEKSNRLQLRNLVVVVLMFIIAVLTLAHQVARDQEQPTSTPELTHAPRKNSPVAVTETSLPRATVPEVITEPMKSSTPNNIATPPIRRTASVPRSNTSPTLLSIASTSVPTVAPTDRSPGPIEVLPTAQPPTPLFQNFDTLTPTTAPTRAPIILSPTNAPPTSSAPPTTLPPAVTGGSLDIGTWCGNVRGALGTAEVIVNEWYCKDGGGNIFPADLNAVCAWQYPGTRAYNPTPDNPYTWMCIP